MSLLPALFQNTDPMPMALGAKIVAPVPKKPDPFKAFEKGNHNVMACCAIHLEAREAGILTDDRPPVVSHRAAIERAELMSFLDGLRKTFFDAACMGTSSQVKGWLTGEFEPLESKKIPVGETVEFFAPDPLTGQTIKAKPAPTLAERRAAVGMPPRHETALREIAKLDQTASDLKDLRRQEASAAKMAEVQRQKQALRALRALVRKDAKR